MKDTFYFQHDYNARNDPKLQDVLIEHGVAGIGVFWCVIEQIYEQGGKLPFKACKSIAFALHIDCKVVESVVNDFDLFQNDGTFFWSSSVLARLNRRKEILERRKKAAETRWKSKEIQQEQCNSNANTQQEQCNSNANAQQKQCNSNANAQQEQCNSNANAQQKQCNSNANAQQKQCNVYPKEIKEKEIKESTSIEVESMEAKAAKRFCPPTLEEVKGYVEEKGYAFFDAERFIDFYTSKGWMVGKNKMKDWQAAVRNWHKSDKVNNGKQAVSSNNNINDEWK